MMDYISPGSNPINVLFVYDRVVKDPDGFILSLIARNFSEKFEPYLDIEWLRSVSGEALRTYIAHREKKNVLEWLAGEKYTRFDYEMNYEYLHSKFKNMYDDSPPSDMDRAIRGFLVSESIQTIYIYNETYDERQRYDLLARYGRNRKIKYVVGKYLKDVLDTVDAVSIVYDWDVDRVYELVKTHNYDDIAFGVADFDFNFEDEDCTKLKHGLDEYDNVSTFPIYRLKEGSLIRG